MESTGLGKIDHDPFCLDWVRETLQRLIITDSMYRIASDPTNAGRFGKGKTTEEIMQKRLYSSASPLPTFMAKYGTQHELPVANRAEHAYLGFFKKCDDMPHGRRLFHPTEITLLHGAVDWVLSRTTWNLHG